MFNTIVSISRIFIIIDQFEYIANHNSIDIAFDIT